MLPSSGQPTVWTTRPGWCCAGVDLPQFLDADPVGLRVDCRRAAGSARSASWSASRGSLRRTGSAARSARCPACSARSARRRLPMPMSPVATPRTRPVSSYSTSAAAKPGIDLDPELLGLLRQPAAQIAEADDVVAVVVHLRRRRQPERPVSRQIQEAVFGRRGVERRAALAASPGSARRARAARAPRPTGYARRPPSPSR